MGPIRISALVVVVLLASCSSATETSAAAPVMTSSSAPSTTEPPFLFGAQTDTTLVIAPGYGPLVALDLDTGNAQRFDDTDGVPGDFPLLATGGDRLAVIEVCDTCAGVRVIDPQRSRS